jgi:radical SAM-linked protein
LKCETHDTQHTPHDFVQTRDTSGNAESWLAGDSNTIAVSRTKRKPAVARVRIAYSKLGEARFIGAKETATMFARAVRRAHLPVAYSEGFHPLPRLSFGPALPLGVESEEEFLDIELSEVLTAGEVSRRLGAELPRGFTVQWAEAISFAVPSIEASLYAFRYHIALHSMPPDKQGADFVATQLNAFHQASSFPMRKHSKGGGKIVDAKQFISQVALTTPCTLSVDTRVTKTGTVKPHEFIGTLFALTPEEVKVLRLTKIQTIFSSSGDARETNLADAEEKDTLQQAAQ